MKGLRVFLIFIFIVLLSFAGTASAEFVAYNDSVGPSSGSATNVTHYSGYLGGGGGFEVPTGLLKDYSTGLFTSVTASLTAVNVAGSIGSMPNAGTDAYNIFNGIVNLANSASYNSSSFNWSYEVTFTGLDPTKYYEFVTTANRGSASYDGSGAGSRWTQFSIIGADTYSNSSSSGVVVQSADVLKLNTGYNTVNGYVVGWSGISASDGSITIRSENVGAGGPGESIKSYGLQGFKLAEVTVIPEPISSTLFVVGAATMGYLRFRKSVKR